jgi:hypothetical protein
MPEANGPLTGSGPAAPRTPEHYVRVGDPRAALCYLAAGQGGGAAIQVMTMV